MSINDQIALAERLRLYLLECAPVPVPSWAFGLDGLLEKPKSMSLQISGGQVLSAYIDGSKKMLMPFSIYYRDVLGNNQHRSAMLGGLNALGEWMDALDEMPYLGESFKVFKLEQSSQASIVEQTMKTITYMAGFVLGYETNPSGFNKNFG